MSEAFGCFKTWQRVGTSFVGVADVVGARDVGGDVRGDLEVVAVEVKKTSDKFGRILGQAISYSLFAHKCYLAIPFSDYEAFSFEQKELAARLGVGLFEIKKEYKVWRCHEVLTSANHFPHGHQVETLLRRGLDLARCGLCGVFFEVNDLSESFREALKKGKPYASFRDADRKLLFSRRRNQDLRRLYLCRDCIKDISTALSVRID